MSDIHISNPLDDLQNLSQDERIELAIIAIRNTGKTAQGRDVLSLRKAATTVFTKLPGRHWLTKVMIVICIGRNCPIDSQHVT